MKVLKNAFWLTAARIAGDLSSFLLFVSISRTFGPATTGEYSYSFALASLVAFLACSGFDEYGTALYARSLEDSGRRRLWSDILGAQYLELALTALCFAAFLLLTGSAHARPTVIMELAALLTGQYLARTFFVPAMASQHMRRPALTDLGCRLAAILFALGCIAATRASLPALLAGFPVAGAVLVVLAARTARAHGASLRPTLEMRRIARTLRSTAPFTGCELLGQFYARTDFLLIAFLLGNASVGLYATDMKLVEYGVMPLYLLGIAAYPSLSRAAAFDPATFAASVRELARVLFFLAGWAAVGIYFFAPLLIVPIFGPRFAAAAQVLPWFAVLALMKGGEGTLYRVAYAVRRPTVYFVSMLAGTALTIVLNVLLIPRLGIEGAVIAAIASVGLVIGVCSACLRHAVPRMVLIGAVVRVAAALGATAGIVYGVELLEAPAWLVALVACAGFPLFGLSVGLLPHPMRSRLLHPQATGTQARAASLGTPSV